MSEVLNFLWAKSDSSNKGDLRWHPLVLHLLDVAASADAILAREPKSTRQRLAAIFGMPWEEARPWFLLIVACHDLGKACPGFQCKWPELLSRLSLKNPRSPSTDINHAFVSQGVLAEWLRAQDWPDDLADLVADAVGCHHGMRAASNTLDRLMGDRRALGESDWEKARQELLESLFTVFKPSKPPAKKTLSGPDFMLLAGLTSFADWIGSNEDWFPFGNSDDCQDLQGWFERRRTQADRALDAIGWLPRSPLCSEEKSFDQVFSFQPRPLQEAVAEFLAAVSTPSILLMEAPMGEGKTEAAFYGHLALQRKFGHRGLYVALPTKATGNAMFARTLGFISRQGKDRQLDLQLLHGATQLNETFQNLRLSGIHDESFGGEVRAGEWFTHKKRALLSEYGVGTVDQALLTILPVRHQFVRLWGLANRVVIFDEIHAYDSYTGTLLAHLLRWLLALGSSVILLSATLSPSTRRKLAEVVKGTLPEQEADYPRLTLYSPDNVKQVHIEADPERRRVVRLQSLPADVTSLQAALMEHLADGGMGLALVNTVQRAQDLYRLFPAGAPLVRNGQRVGKRLSDGTEIFLFHARFPAEWRQQREDQALEVFGEKGCRAGRKILIATQVAEQSLDLDFDLIVTDLAPIDLVLQRAGRLWRHPRNGRPLTEPLLVIAGLSGDEPPDFGQPLWWGAVYREDVLLRTWCLLRGMSTLILPDQIDALVASVYEEEVEVPEALQERLCEAIIQGDGADYSRKNQANHAFIGFPDDASWNDTGRGVKADEDEPGLHPTLIAQTRLGDPSVVVIPLFPGDGFDPTSPPEFFKARAWSLRSMSLSRKGVVRRCQALGVPEAWKKSTLLRNSFPLELNEEGRWKLDESVRLDDDLGLVYDTKEEA
ncbi:CRISPR-associated Cas3 family helicase [Geothermobacter ehrlichii]|uniref:CRISPR-associated Cas3 family helicase n=1 Tax=Geothermobacter ehrlichii TaxID=213224 RepID=A0A5D3WKE8_9BACT|nr:CRISPR-associated Cas3 family helicase [Geothermobacter ehrlichii]